MEDDNNGIGTACDENLDILKLPEHILLKIISFIDDTANVALSCKQLYQLVCWSSRNEIPLNLCYKDLCDPQTFLSVIESKRQFNDLTINDDNVNNYEDSERTERLPVDNYYDNVEDLDDVVDAKQIGGSISGENKEQSETFGSPTAPIRVQYMNESIGKMPIYSHYKKSFESFLDEVEHELYQWQEIETDYTTVPMELELQDSEVSKIILILKPLIVNLILKQEQSMKTVLSFLGHRNL